jgi:NADH-quinone oxidoreductase subunit C
MINIVLEIIRAWSRLSTSGSFMIDETKGGPNGGSSETPAKPPPESASPASPPKSAPGESVAPAPPAATVPPGAPLPAPAKPPAAAPAKPATGAPAAPAKPAPKPVVKPEPWSSPLVEEIKRRFPDAVIEAVTFRNQPSVTLERRSLIAVCEFLKSNEGGAYVFLTDETAVDYPKRDKRFEIIYQLYSFKLNSRLRLKVMAGEGERVPSVSGLWAAANWLECEVYDMFGVQYEGHPDLKRILLPDGWTGHPLRKDYDILKQDDAWVQATLGIPSGQ